ncbi:MAG: DNA cytosine methyltransferase [Phycisphaerales bacterium]|nr:DNA cytosine methyltransferase [Phycisphaerales bacterium]
MADPVNILSLYSGSGMHDEAVCAALRVLGLAPRVLGYVEREASAAAWLLARMEAATVEPAPVWCGDLCDLDARPMRGWVDLVVASPPCQPYSSAGKRLGNADERSHGAGDGPLPHTVRIIDECRPALVWFENVPEWVTGGHFRGFGEELCGLGYDISPPIFLAAADVGAPHERERVFILCRLADAGGSSVFASTAGLAIRSRGGVASSAGSRMADAKGPRREGQEPAGDTRTGGRAGEQHRGMGNAERADARAGEAGEQGGAGIGRRGLPDAGDGIPMFPPGRNDYAAWAALAAGGLDPACMPAVERGLSALAHGLGFSNSELLRLGGNGVVPLAAGAAFIAAFRGGA